MKKIGLFLYFIIILYIFTGCTNNSLKVKPEITDNNIPIYLNCRIDYSGNKNYLPKNLLYNKLASTIATYSYKVKYINGNTNFDTLNLFNPLVIVGFPLGEESVLTEGILKISKNSKTKIFTSSCISTSTRSLFHNAGSTQARKSCLIAIRDNISKQLNNYQKDY